MRKKLKNSSAFVIAFLAICVALNYVGSNIALFLRLPIYLDTIGTMLAGLVLGPVFGMVAALISGLISWMTTDIFALYFSPVAILVGFLAGLILKPAEAHKSVLLAKALAISLPGTILSSLITVVLFHGITSSGSSLLVQLLHGFGLNLTASIVLVQAGTDYLDRLVVIFIVMLLLKILTQRLPHFREKLE